MKSSLMIAAAAIIAIAAIGAIVLVLREPGTAEVPADETAVVKKVTPKKPVKGLPRVRHHWWTKSGGVAITTFVTGGNVRLHEPFTDRTTDR